MKMSEIIQEITQQQINKIDNALNGDGWVGMPERFYDGSFSGAIAAFIKRPILASLAKQFRKLSWAFKELKGSLETIQEIHEEEKHHIPEKYKKMLVDKLKGIVSVELSDTKSKFHNIYDLKILGKCEISKDVDDSDMIKEFMINEFLGDLLWVNTRDGKLKEE
jgi:hypothetical protein